MDYQGSAASHEPSRPSDEPSSSFHEASTRCPKAKCREARLGGASNAASDRSDAFAQVDRRTGKVKLRERVVSPAFVLKRAGQSVSIYHLPYDERHPVVCFDETSKLCLSTLARHCRQNRETRRGKMTSTSAAGQLTSSWQLNRSRVDWSCSQPGTADMSSVQHSFDIWPISLTRK